MQRIRLINASDQTTQYDDEPKTSEHQKTDNAQDQPVRMDARSLLRSVLRNVWRHRVPVLTQTRMAESGITCLAMILSYHSRNIPVSEISAKWQVGRDDLSADNLAKAARGYGMRVRTLSVPLSDFRLVTLPAIVHWQSNHFVVVERWSSKGVDLVDPAQGRRHVTHDEFNAGFTGMVLTLEPGAHFDRHAIATRRSIGTYLFQYIQRTPLTSLQVLAASLLLQLFGLLLPLLTKVVVDQILPFKIGTVMPLLGVGILLIILTQAATTLLREWSLAYLQARTDLHIMGDFCEHLLMLPYSFFQQRSSGDLLARLSSNTMVRDTLGNQLVSTLLDSSMVTIYLFVLLWQSPPFGLLTFVIGLLQILLLLGTHRLISKLTGRELEAQGKSQGYLNEALSGIATLKAAGAEHHALARWSNLFSEQVNLTARRGYLAATINTIIVALRSLAPLALLWMGTVQVLNGSLSVGTMLALNALAIGFLLPLNSLVSSGQQLQTVQAHLERLADVTTTPPEQDRETVHVPPRLTGHIQLNNVGFCYTPDSDPVLHDITLEVQAGQKVAIVGPTGSGKSTLGKLLLGLYPPTHGTIAYDGIPLHTLDYQHVRRQFGAVMQDASIFSGSVLENITFNNPSMNTEQVAEAAHIAALDHDIDQWPMGYETFVAEGGSALSGGQRQRLAIARAVAHHPAILLLDEATSHLDVLTEQRLEAQLQALACTQIIIAHRLSTIRNADVILVIHQGTIVEQGTHQQLLAARGYYARLITQQVEHKTIKAA